MEYAPEPYLVFGSGPTRCIFVSTNPGQGYTYQLSPSREATSIFHGTRSYSEAAAKLGRFYAAPLSPISAAARSNIASMRRIGELFGASKVMQVEAVPWHCLASSKARNAEWIDAG